MWNYWVNMGLSLISYVCLTSPGKVLPFFCSSHLEGALVTHCQSAPCQELVKAVLTTALMEAHSLCFYSCSFQTQTTQKPFQERKFWVTVIFFFQPGHLLHSGLSKISYLPWVWLNLFLKLENHLWNNYNEYETELKC